MATRTEPSLCWYASRPLGHHSRQLDTTSATASSTASTLSAWNLVMAAGRSSPTLRPTSSLSPKMTSRSLSPHANSRVPKQRNVTKPAHLPPLPRFHPANWPSQVTATTNTPSSGRSSPQQPSSPRQHHRQVSEVQRQLYMYQRELMVTTMRGAQEAAAQRPTSPRLIPQGSAGPITPMMLEEHDGYLNACWTSAGRSSGNAVEEDLAEKLIRQEAQWAGRMSPRRGAR